jgi:hypothetical protein
MITKILWFLAVGLAAFIAGDGYGYHRAEHEMALQLVQLRDQQHPKHKKAAPVPVPPPLFDDIEYVTGVWTATDCKLGLRFSAPNMNGDAAYSYPPTEGHWQIEGDILRIFVERESDGKTMKKVSPYYTEWKFNRVDNNNMDVTMLTGEKFSLHRC